MAYVLTETQDKVLDIVFDIMGESRINRSLEEYMAIAAKLPPLKQLLYLVNERFAPMHEAGQLPL